MLDFRMETFLKVCEYMNFTHAADALNLTQPAVSQHIKYLEEEYETSLFVRDKKKLVLTSAGKILRSSLETMRNDETTLKQRMQASLDGRKVLTFGVTMTIGEYAIVDALANYIKLHPDTDIKVRYGNTQKLLSYLHNGEIDFAIVEGYFNTGDYDTRIYKSEEYIAVASKTHKFSKSIKYLKDLTSERLLVREHGSGTRAILSKTLAIKNLSVNDFKHIVEVGNIHTIVNLLCQDCGISFLYKSAVEEELNTGVLKKIPLTDFVVMHDFTFLWNKDSAFSEEYESIFKELKSYDC
ncbi:LysR family transcriptional regulator [Breznakia pachnodae]|uniref:DNA-binding transcriptional LysR family regulator n=1 Tax=Breznakia pachnodae TaxID=265178 RepID=A0ABU0E5Z8_9FIRM|nr:LysR family transcriptional regulator [Breznakia pachnodae]MDQ0361925.1 DNA-binding transcriptional LysR family regulator [Breznakia pachnodae]